jgi:hypothetical protein
VQAVVMVTTDSMGKQAFLKNHKKINHEPIVTKIGRGD